MRWLLPAALLATTVACGTDTDSDTESTQTDTEEAGPAYPAAVPEYSGGDCPTFEAGNNKNFQVGDEKRSFRLYLPDEPEGAPLVFVWHWLGGNSAQAASAFDTQALADEKGWIVVVPESLDDRAFEWNFLVEAEGNTDLLFFDDLLSCVDDNFSPDLERVYVTGMSAGGLWTTYLGVHRSQHFTAVAPLAGGMFDESYVTPERNIPWMLTWGGPEDIVFMSFHDANLEHLANLTGDDFFVVACEHDEGHVFPSVGNDYLWDFFTIHDGSGELPLANGLTDAYPDFCALSEDFVASDAE